MLPLSGTLAAGSAEAVPHEEGEHRAGTEEELDAAAVTIQVDADPDQETQQKSSALAESQPIGSGFDAGSSSQGATAYADNSRPVVPRLALNTNRSGGDSYSSAARTDYAYAPPRGVRSRPFPPAGSEAEPVRRSSLAVVDLAAGALSKVMGAATTANRFLARGHTVHYRDRDHHKEIARGLLHRHKLHKRKRRLERAGLLMSGGGTKGKGKKRRRYSAYSYGQYDQAGSRPRWGQQEDRSGYYTGAWEEGQGLSAGRVRFLESPETHEIVPSGEEEEEEFDEEEEYEEEEEEEEEAVDEHEQVGADEKKHEEAHAEGEGQEAELEEGREEEEEEEEEFDEVEGQVHAEGEAEDAELEEGGEDEEEEEEEFDEEHQHGLVHAEGEGQEAELEEGGEEEEEEEEYDEEHQHGLVHAEGEGQEAELEEGGEEEEEEEEYEEEHQHGLVHAEGEGQEAELEEGGEEEEEEYEEEAEEESDQIPPPTNLKPPRPAPVARVELANTREAPGNIQKARVKFEVVKQGAPPRPKAAAQVEGAHRLTQEEGDVEFDAAVVQRAPQGLSRHSLSTEGEHAMGFGGGFGGKGMKGEGKSGGKHPHHDDHVTPQFLNAYPIISLGYPLVQVIVFYSNNPGPDDEFYMDRTLRPNAVNAWRDVTCLTAENPTPRGCPAFKDQRDDFMRFFLYALHHTDSGHLFGNIVLECLFGPPLECAHGNPRFLALVLLGVFGGSLAVAAVNPTKIVVGSSGYAYAVLFMHLGNLVLNWNELGLLPGVKLLPRSWRQKRVDTSHYSRCAKFKLTGEVPRNMFTAIVVGFVIFLQVVGSVQAEIDGAPMSHAAHVGGGLFGLLASFLFVKNLVPESMEQMFVVVAGTLLFVIFLVLSIHIWTGQSAGGGGPDSLLELAPWECTCCDDGVNYCALTTTSSTAAPADNSRMLVRNLYDQAVGLGN